ncbi:glycosyltransferase family 2 protein [Shimia abyssi]|uniref:Galactose binding lectin-like protein n=1 Tax=Shimia abyssi TaxID=1662395 RepID=A0A2P8F787_9RHOB|nr:glycosyltransferase family 2 protein [Shimia abyssi]PSL17574.1 galactose binding lectin-like protein [Shimia abyssi]
MMLAFNSQKRAALRCRATFSEHSYANFSFFDPATQDILFHLSLRFGEQTAVLNKRFCDTWGGEQKKAVALRLSENHVEILLSPPAVTVFINGKKVFSERRRYPHLDKVRYLDFQGGVVDGSLALDCTVAPPDAQLRITHDLRLAGHLFQSPAQPTFYSLSCSAPTEAPRLLSFCIQDQLIRNRQSGTELGLRGLLPGRLWADLPPYETLTLELLADSTPIGLHAQLSRPELREIIELLCTAKSASPDTTTLLLAIEHVRFAQIWETLSDNAQHSLLETAERHGVTSFLFPNSLPSYDTSMTASSPHKKEAEKIPRSLLQKLSNTDEDIIDLLGQLPDPQNTTRGFLAAELPELFFFSKDGKRRQGQHFFDLLPATSKGSMSWHRGTALPRLLFQEDVEAMTELMATLHVETGEHIATPALAWTLQAVICGHPVSLPWAQREEIIRAYMALMDRWASVPWGRTACSTLVQTAVTFLEHIDLVPEPFGHEIEDFILRIHGLSAHFWHLLDMATKRHAIVPSSKCKAGQRAFQKIENGARDDETAIETALSFFAPLKSPNLPKVRREILGVSGTTTTPRHSLIGRMRSSGLAFDETALRTLAYPGIETFTKAEQAELGAAARQEIIRRYEELPKAPALSLQTRASHQISHLIRNLHSGGENERTFLELETIDRNLQALMDSQTGYLGFGLYLVLFRQLLDLSASQSTQHVFCQITQLFQHLPEAAHEAPAVLSARFALSAVPVTTDDRYQKVLTSFLGSSMPSMALPPETRIHLEPSGIFDTLVVVFSCRAHLDSRIPAMKTAWLGKLDALGIPYVVVVGQGQGTLNDDILELDAPDDYEGLPQKTLAAVKWVYEKTCYSHLLKIDDDSFLDADAFFHAQSYRKFDYYGRFLSREVGQMDRLWHCEKSTSKRGRLEIDKSPEPSTYADGGSAYCLSRRAMAHLLENQRRLDGIDLILSSFMEDKLIGDLLALSKITVSEEDYYVSIRRRLSPTSPPVPRWENSFFSSRATPVVQHHLDEISGQSLAVKLQESWKLYPKKIWPSYSAPKLRYNSNALELVSSEKTLQHIIAAPITVVSCVRNELRMLPQFLEHYRRLGVEGFLIVDNLSDDGTLEYLLDQPDVSVFSADTDYKAAQYGAVWQQTLLSNFRVGKWSLIADADEFLVLEGTSLSSFNALLEEMEAFGADAGRVLMLDMYPSGPLSKTPFDTRDPIEQACYIDKAPFLRTWPGLGRFCNGKTFTSATRHRLFPDARPNLFLAQKIALLKYKPWMQLSAGLHYAADITLAQRDLLFWHFKYHARFLEKIHEEVNRNQHFNNAEEYRRYQNRLSGSTDTIYQAHLSCRWHESTDVQDILKGIRL